MTTICSGRVGESKKVIRGENVVKIIKRSGIENVFDRVKIENAVKKANITVEEDERLTDGEVKDIAMDIEQRCGFTGGKYTDVNTLFAVIVAGVLSAAFFIGLCYVPQQIRETKYVAMILSRGWTPYVMVSLLILAGVILFVKWRKLAFQRLADFFTALFSPFDCVSICSHLSSGLGGENTFG